MIPEEIDEARETRSRLWAKACAHEITVDQLYAALKRLRDRIGDELYRIPRIGRR